MERGSGFLRMKRLQVLNIMRFHIILGIILMPVSGVSDHHQLKTDTANFKTTTHPAAIWMDHHDHLPSCLHIVVAETEQNALEPFRTGHLTRSVYDWANFYQSPHLIGLNPPPVVTPL
jgi:hypothetical protein